jgi:ribulose-5-phosphate 4-epimerase/fuculose-1-phosphate aldolase
VSTLAATQALLVTANRVLANENVLDAFGHVSARHPQRSDWYLLSCSRSPALVSVDDLMEFDLTGHVIGSDTRKPYLERFIHGAIYEARPDVHAIVHTHAHDLIPFGVTNTPVRPLMHVAAAIGKHVPVWDIAERFGDSSLLVTNMNTARDLATKLGSNTTALMRGHGAVVVGSSVRNAVLTAVYLQINARIDLRARTLGEVTYLSDGEIAHNVDSLLGDNPATRAWEYLERRCPPAPG